MRSSFSSSNGNDSDGSHFAPDTSLAVPFDLSGVPLIYRYRVEELLKLTPKEFNSAGKCGFFSKKSVGPHVREKFTFKDMLCFQKDPIPTSLLKINNNFASQEKKLIQIISMYIGVVRSNRVIERTLYERVNLARKLYEQTLKRPELRDELFMQIWKQTINNTDRQCSIKAWELMNLFASSMPPSEDIGLSDYVRDTAHGIDIRYEVRIPALNTLKALERTVKAGPRHTIPGREEIESFLTCRKLTTTVFFLDETSTKIAYDMATTVADAVEEIAGIIQLSAYSSFSLFECCKVVTGSKSPDTGNEEYVELDDNKYIGDLLADFKAAKDRSKGESLQCKLVFKKRLFRESDEAIADQMFVHLSYVQLQHDYILGNYLVGRDAAAQLSALQFLVKIGFVSNLASWSEWDSCLKRFLPRQIAITRTKQEWERDILSRYNSLEHLTKDDARQQFLRILRTFPYGNSVFYSVGKINDPFGLLPKRIVMGINKRGVHFFCPVPKGYVHSAELRDIMQFGSNNTSVFFKMRVAGVLHVFQFKTKQGKEICAALRTHIDDTILHRYSKARSSGTNSVNGDVSNTFKPPSIELYEKRVQDLPKAVEESQKYTDQLLEEMREKEQQEVKLREELESLEVTLRSKKKILADTECDLDKLRSCCNEKDEALQAAIREKKSIEAKLNNIALLENTAKKDLVGTNNQILNKLQDDFRTRNEELRAAEEATSRLINELEQRIAKLEKRKVDEYTHARPGAQEHFEEEGGCRFEGEDEGWGSSLELDDIEGLKVLVEEHED